MDVSNATATMDTPGPGVYPGTPMEDYHAWGCASNSRLSRLMKSPAHLKAYIEEPAKEDTPARKLGRAIHMAVLEPGLFAEHYTTAGVCEASTKDGKACTNAGLFVHKRIGWVCGVHARNQDDDLETVEREVLTAGDHETCVRVRDAVHAHSMARGLVTGPGQVEMSMVWKDRATGVLCKSRWDRHTPEIAGGSVVDLKSSLDSSIFDFERASFNWGYHRQAAFYLRGARARRLPVRSFSIIAVEKEPPYAVAVYRISDAVVDNLTEQLDSLLELYAECMGRDQWPGYPEIVRDISLPKWGWDKIDEQTAEVREALRLIRAHEQGEAAA
jgi:hypothetical protein